MKYYNPSNGVRIQGEINIDHFDGVTADDGYRYFDGNGVLQHGWLDIAGGRKYARPSNGVEIRGTTEYIDGFQYTFDANGFCLNDTPRQIELEIFNAYNNYRASCGLNRVTWDQECHVMARGSAQGCANVGQLQHRLGIPLDKQNSYSDILLFASKPITGSEAVNKWHNSDGHRRMMKCTSATKAAVGVIESGGRRYCVIVYNFVGTNQMLNG